MSDTSHKSDGITNINQVDFKTNNKNNGVVNNINAPTFNPQYHITTRNVVTVRQVSRREFDEKPFLKFILETQNRYGDLNGTRRQITDDMLRNTPLVIMTSYEGDVMKTLGYKQSTTDVFVLFPNGSPDEALTAFTGDPGSGKSVYLKILQYYFTKQGNIPLLITIKSIDIKGENITFAQFVKRNGCSGYPISGSEEDSFGRWLYENDGRIIFLLDGWDEAAFKVKSNVKMTNLLDRAPVASWIGLLLSGDIMPKCKIVLTSRPSSLLNLPITRRPDVVYSLNGFEGESLIHAVNIYNEKNGGEIVDFINKEFIDENPFIRLPFTISLISLTFKKSSRKFSSSDITLTQVYKLAFDEKSHSVHNRIDDEEEEEKAVDDNKHEEMLVDEMMYKLLVENKLNTLTVDDIRKHKNLTPQLVENHSFVNILSQRSSHRIDDKHQIVELRHRTIAEFHAARFMLRGMDLEVFKKSIKELFVMEDYDKKMMIRRFLSGLVNDHEYDSETLKEKTQFLIGKLINELKSSMAAPLDDKMNQRSLEYRHAIIFQGHLLNDLSEMTKKVEYIRSHFSADSFFHLQVEIRRVTSLKGPIKFLRRIDPNIGCLLLYFLDDSEVEHFSTFVNAVLNLSKKVHIIHIHRVKLDEEYVELVGKLIEKVEVNLLIVCNDDIEVDKIKEYQFRVQQQMDKYPSYPVMRVFVHVEHRRHLFVLRHKEYTDPTSAFILPSYVGYGTKTVNLARYRVESHERAKVLINVNLEHQFLFLISQVEEIESLGKLVQSTPNIHIREIRIILPNDITRDCVREFCEILINIDNKIEAIRLFNCSKSFIGFTEFQLLMQCAYLELKLVFIEEWSNNRIVEMDKKLDVVHKQKAPKLKVDMHFKNEAMIYYQPVVTSTVEDKVTTKQEVTTNVEDIQAASTSTNDQQPTTSAGKENSSRRKHKNCIIS